MQQKDPKCIDSIKQNFISQVLKSPEWFHVQESGREVIDLHSYSGIQADEGSASSTCAFQEYTGHHHSSQQDEGKNLEQLVRRFIGQALFPFTLVGLQSHGLLWLCMGRWEISSSLMLWKEGKNESWWTDRQTAMFAMLTHLLFYSICFGGNLFIRPYARYCVYHFIDPFAFSWSIRETAN